MLTGILLANGNLSASILNSLFNENLVKEGEHLWPSGLVQTSSGTQIRASRRAPPRDAPVVCLIHIPVRPHCSEDSSSGGPRFHIAHFKHNTTKYSHYNSNIIISKQK